MRQIKFYNAPVPVGDIQPPSGDHRWLPQFFRASPELIADTSGVLAEALAPMLEPCGFKYVTVDSRLHMLMKGMYPAIPGWHCDDFWRPTGQPDLWGLPPQSHLAVVWDFGAQSFTDFAMEPLQTMIDDDSPTPFYGQVSERLHGRKIIRRQVAHGELWQFRGLDLHRAMPATANGWRYFIRATHSNHWEPKDEIRTQTQVYMTEPFIGW